MWLSSRPAALTYCLHAVECQIDLRCRIFRNLAARGIAAEHARTRKAGRE